MLTAVILLSVAALLVLYSRWHEIPSFRRYRWFNWLRKLRFKEQCRTPLTKDARDFAEQWSKHPTLSRRELDLIRRSMKRKDLG